MKKIFIVIVLIFIFLIGIKIGGNFTLSASNLFETKKSEFEQQIIEPNNEYIATPLVPEENIDNKIAHKIDDTIQSIIEKLLSTIF